MMMGEERKIVKDFDKDGDKRLNASERAAAREKLASEPKRGFGPRGGQRNETPPEPGAKFSLAQAKKYTKEPLYDTSVLRTIFLGVRQPGLGKGNGGV